MFVTHPRQLHYVCNPPQNPALCTLPNPNYVCCPTRNPELCTLLNPRPLNYVHYSTQTPDLLTFHNLDPCTVYITELLTPELCTQEHILSPSLYATPILRNSVFQVHRHVDIFCLELCFTLRFEALTGGRMEEIITLLRVLYMLPIHNGQ